MYFGSIFKVREVLSVNVEADMWSSMKQTVSNFNDYKFKIPLKSSFLQRKLFNHLLLDASGACFLFSALWKGKRNAWVLQGSSLPGEK